MNSIKKNIYSVSYNILNKINELKDIHKGESCYIIGDGISLKWFDLEKFNDKVSISTGLLPFHNDFDKINTEYCLLTEPFWFLPFHKTTVPPIKYIRNRIQKEYRKIINNKVDKQFIVNLSNYFLLKRKNVKFIFQDIPGSELVSHFLSKGIDPFAGSARTSILFAIHLGFKQAHLVGFDYTHSPGKSHHWYEKGEGVEFDQKNYNEIFFSIANEYIDLTTVTLNGKSNVMNYVSYEHLTNDQPLFVENDQLIDNKYLEALSAWPDYNIY